VKGDMEGVREGQEGGKGMGGRGEAGMREEMAKDSQDGKTIMCTT